MGKGRLEAFSDGVIAIIITIMVLELKVQHGTTLTTLLPMLPAFSSYILSFVFIGIYWNNHHHMLHITQKINGRILWANLHLLFWLSLIPFTTAWMGHNHFATMPVALYGVDLFMSGLAYFILAHALVANHAKNSTLAIALGKDYKGFISLFCYASAIPLAFINTAISIGLYIFVAMMWFIPDRRIEKLLKN